MRLLLTSPASGVENMALDEALMARARRTGEWVFRVYAWREPTVSFGRNQRAVGAYDPSRLAERGIHAVRRPTGGRAILHHREVTYSVTGPDEGAGTLQETYERINGILLDGLHALGVPAAVATATRAIAPGPIPCFAEPSAGELVVGDRKLVGSAQYRHEGALLQHGSILVEDDQARLAELTTASDGALPVATLREALGRTPALEEVAAALHAAVRARFSDATALSDAELLAVANEARTFATLYADAAWTWRR